MVKFLARAWRSYWASVKGPSTDADLSEQQAW